MAKGRETKGPQFVRYFAPVLDALRDLGGSGRPSEVKDLIAEKLGIPDNDLDQTLESGASRVGNQVDWAKFYLSKAGYIDSSTRGVWSLTDKGHSYSPNQAKALELFRRVHKKFVIRKRTGRGGATQEQCVEHDEEDAAVAEREHRLALLAVLRALPASGFESFCQGLLREAGFESVTVTGKSGDGGIDGIGILEMNALVSFKVVFQCKRYSGSIGPDKVRDFRGAMMGRADKGIILTTGTFTVEARKESIRDGVPPIELVDREKMLDMCEQLAFGLKPKKAFEVDREFFAEFGEGAESRAEMPRTGRAAKSADGHRGA